MVLSLTELGYTVARENATVLAEFLCTPTQAQLLALLEEEGSDMLAGLTNDKMSPDDVLRLETAVEDFRAADDESRMMSIALDEFTALHDVLSERIADLPGRDTLFLEILKDEDATLDDFLSPMQYFVWVCESEYVTRVKILEDELAGYTTEQKQAITTAVFESLESSVEVSASTVYVLNIPHNINNEESLRKAFADCGRIYHVTIADQDGTGKHKGSLISFVDAEDAGTALIADVVVLGEGFKEIELKVSEVPSDLIVGRRYAYGSDDNSYWRRHTYQYAEVAHTTEKAVHGGSVTKEDETATLAVAQMLKQNNTEMEIASREIEAMEDEISQLQKALKDAEAQHQRDIELIAELQAGTAHSEPHKVAKVHVKARATRVALPKTRTVRTTTARARTNTMSAAAAGTAQVVHRVHQHTKANAVSFSAHSSGSVSAHHPQNCHALACTHARARIIQTNNACAGGVDGGQDKHCLLYDSTLLARVQGTRAVARHLF